MPMFVVPALLALLLAGCLPATEDLPGRVGDRVPADAAGAGQAADSGSVVPSAAAVALPERSLTLSLLDTAGPLPEPPAVTPAGRKPRSDGESAPGQSDAAVADTASGPEPVTYDFPMVENDRVRHFVEYYSGRGRRSFARWLARSGRYLPMMREIFAEEGLPRDLTYLAMIESGFNDHAYSWAHAVGPWQFIESTGRMMGLENDWWHDERRDFEKATRAAARFLSDLHARFDDWYLAIAAYNAGPGRVAGAIRRYDTRDFWAIARTSYLQPETRNYVPKMLAAMRIAKEPEKYGFEDVGYQSPLDYDEVTVPTATDLEVVARLCRVDYQDVKALNPELKRWCTPPGRRDYTLRVPAGTSERFRAGYADLPPQERANYKRHRIEKGDTLLKLARKYRIRVDDIIALNGIDNPRALSIGTDLILPLKKGYSRQPVAELADDYVRSRRQTYTVRRGDSLWTISRRFDVSERQLRVWNRLGWSNMIRPGQKLVVSASAARKTGGTRTAQADEPTRKINYRVRAGDTLWDIGRQFDVATSEIMDWNDIDDDHVLRPGDELTLLVPASRARG